MTSTAMKKPFPSVGSLLNVAIAIATVVLAVIIINLYRNRRLRENSPRPALAAGQKFPLTDIDWSRNRRTLLLGLSTKCSYCTESAPLYQSLTNYSAREVGFQLVALFPETVNEAKQYLADHQIQIADVRQNALVSLGFRGTPTAVVVDESGTVLQAWLGRLTAEEEKELIGLLGKRPELSSPSPEKAAELRMIGEDGLKRMREAGEKIVLVDIRERAAYTAGHLDGSKNIPLDELEARASNELSWSSLVVISCRCPNENSPEIASLILKKARFPHVSILSETSTPRPSP